MSTNPYEPAAPSALPGASDPDSPPPGPLGSAWRGAKRGARIAAWVSGVISSMLIIPALAVTAFGLGSGRGFGVSSYVLSGVAVFSFFTALGGLAGVIGGLLGRLGRRHDPRMAGPAQPPRGFPPRRRRRRLWPWFVGVPLVIILAASFIAGAYVGRLVDRRLAAAVAAADRDDPNWRLDSLLAHREQVPDAENSALVMDEVTALVPASWPDRPARIMNDPGSAAEPVKEAFDQLDETPGNVKLSDSAAEALRGDLKSHDKAIRLARTLANFRRGRHELKIGPTVFDTPLAQSQQARIVARLLAADAAIQAQDGKFDAALDSCRAIFAAGRSIGDEPFLISGLVRIAIGEVGLKATERVLGQGEASDETLVRLQEVILDEMSQPLLLVGVKGERAVLAEVIARVRSGQIPISELGDGRRAEGGAAGGAVAPWGRLWFDQQQAVALEWMNEAVAISRRPEDERPALWSQWGAIIDQARQSPLERYTAMIPILFTPGVPAASIASSRYQTDLRQRDPPGRRAPAPEVGCLAVVDRRDRPINPAEPTRRSVFRRVVPCGTSQPATCRLFDRAQRSGRARRLRPQALDERRGRRRRRSVMGSLGARDESRPRAQSGRKTPGTAQAMTRSGAPGRIAGLRRCTGFRAGLAAGSRRGRATTAWLRPFLWAAARASSAASKSEYTSSAHDGNVATPIETVTDGVMQSSSGFDWTARQMFSATCKAPPRGARGRTATTRSSSSRATMSLARIIEPTVRATC